MDGIQNNLLSDTLNLVQLARETARIRGSQKQADKLTPVVSQLKTLVTQQRETAPAEATGILAQDDFQSLLSASKRTTAGSTGDARERNQVIVAMASGGMTDVDIARQMGMPRDEVRMVVNLANSTSRRIS
ncbi:DUF6115 domain-containing protein [Leptolinea tardivitalis]|uniref:Uncharacterized protein n=1 Tax=Leptolinea tardivitalis TaxID=229920 RepID=A0A0P6X9H4_9CHLR|nr:hypothetical protein [Leptolinea tardivitalis]KPL71077.1 hypothetical protein ADM99_12425 [Leptolinea tardivitalis]GAP22496.1 hypothetical protein LTAR_02728 [Leptolinea tardivitalis]